MFGVSERRACKVLGHPRSTHRYEPIPGEDEQGLTEEIVELASRYGRYGYRRVTALLRMEGWDVNHKRVERIWRREGLKVPAKQPKRGRLWLNDGSCVRLQPQGPNHVWAYDFVLVRTQDSRAVRLLTVIDEYTRECLAIRADRQIPILRRNRDPCRADDDQGSARSHTLRQRTGVYSQGCAGVAWASGSQDAVH